MKLCSNCVKHPSLIDYIQKNGVGISKCSICGEDNQKILPKYTQEFINLFRTIIRYYFSEWEYHSKLGGDDIQELLMATNPVINRNPDIVDEEDYLYCAIDDLIDPLIDFKGISLISAYGRDIYHYSPKEALKDKANAELSDIAAQLVVKNYFLLEPAAKLLLQRIIPDITKIVPQNEHYYRSRIGYFKRARPADISYDKSYHYEPFTGKEIGAPPPNHSSLGRLNRQGVSFLYLATKVGTAIAEVRPHPAQYISIGKFQSNRSLKVADFANIDFLAFSANEKKLDDLHLVASIDEILKEPVPPDKKQLYCLPQLLSDVLRHLGFDGILFNSSLTDGQNLTIFDPDNFTYVEQDAAVHLISEVKYSDIPQENIDNNEAYIATQKHTDLDWHYEM